MTCPSCASANTRAISVETVKVEGRVGLHQRTTYECEDCGEEFYYTALNDGRWMEVK